MPLCARRKAIADLLAFLSALLLLEVLLVLVPLVEAYSSLVLVIRPASFLLSSAPEPFEEARAFSARPYWSCAFAQNELQTLHEVFGLAWVFPLGADRRARSKRQDAALT